MNETNPTDSADTPSKASEPSAPEQTAPVEAKGALDAAKEKARAAAEGVKDLKEKLAKHDLKAELRDAFAETKKNPASLWKKPETLRPGKDLAVVGLAASVVLLLLLLVTSSSFFGLVCLVLGLGALLFSALGLKTEGRKLAVGGSVVSLLVVLFALGQTFGTSGGSEGGKATDGYSVLVANEGKKTGKAEKIIAKAAENAVKLNSLNFFGFHTGMSLADFKTLREHFGLTKDQLWGYFNVENGEVYRICFTGKALDKIAHWPNNFDTVELEVLNYFGIVEWNNIKEVIQGEVDSIFQSDEERLLFGEKGNVPRQYRTADGVVAKLFPKGWDIPTREVFDLLDTTRQKSAAPVFRRFEQKNRMRKRLQELTAQGVKVKMLQLPSGYEWLLREFDKGVWISAFPMTREEFTWLFHDCEYKNLDKTLGFDAARTVKHAIGNANGFADKFNALPPDNKGGFVRFREPFPEEMKKAFSRGILDEKKYKEMKKWTGGDPSAISAVIVADEAMSGQLNRPPMFIVHEPASPKGDKGQAWNKYKEERNNLIRQGKSDSQLTALGYGMDAREWSENYDKKGKFDDVAKKGGVIDDTLIFLPASVTPNR